MKRRVIATMLVAAMLIGTVVSASGCSSEESDGKTHITMLQYKPEAVKAFEKMEEEFNATHDEIGRASCRERV